TNSQPSITLSDESIKTDIETLSNASELLLELQPRTYSYTTLENRPNALEGGLQYGFIAQEVQEVLPNIVKASTLPPPADSTGFSESEGMELLGIQYEK
ncbi:MAG TPA: tail fiber domain-containing protein, partial [Cryomorphaceae bacterium]|nr:tail fiber domain-containing protein [Cryomorphaceae bacterium]